MLRNSLVSLKIRTKGYVFFRQSILKGLEGQTRTDGGFDIVDRPYPIGEIVRRMVRIKKRCMNAIAHGDDAEHALLRGEYKYFTGKPVDARGASVADLIAFIQCCSFFKFYDTSALDRVLEELSLKISTLQPLEVLALMSAVSDLPSKSEGNVDFEEIKRVYDEADDVVAEVQQASTGGVSVLDSEIVPGSSTVDRSKGSAKMSPVDLRRLKSGALQGPSSGGGDMLEITQNKNFTDFRYRKYAVGSSPTGVGIKQVRALEGSEQAAANEAATRAARLEADHTYHQTLSASFFKELSDQAIVFLGSANEEGAVAQCQYSVEEQLEMLSTLPEHCSQELVMALLDNLAAPLIHYEHHMQQLDAGEEVALSEVVERGDALMALYSEMPWHAVTVLKGLLLVKLETAQELVAAESALQVTIFGGKGGGQVRGGENEDGEDEEILIGRGVQASGKRGLDAHATRTKKSLAHRIARATAALEERKDRNAGNAAFILKAAEALSVVIASEAAKTYEVPNAAVHEVGDGEAAGADDDDLLAYGRQCSDAIPNSDKRKLVKDFAAEYLTSGGAAGGQGLGTGSLNQQRMHGRTHKLTTSEIASATSGLSAIAASLTGLIDPDSTGAGSDGFATGSVPLDILAALQQAYMKQLHQCDAATLAAMFSLCRPDGSRYRPPTDGEMDEEAEAAATEAFLAAQKQFFSFLRAAEDRVLYHSLKFTLADITDVMGAYMEAYGALASVHNDLCTELRAVGNAEGSGEGAAIRKEIAASKARMSTTAVVIEELLEGVDVHLTAVTSGQVQDPRTVLSLLTCISLHAFSLNDNAPPTSAPAGTQDGQTVTPLSHQQLWFNRFTRLQRIIHRVGALIVCDAKQYGMDDVITVLQVGVRMGDKMLDAAVTAALQRLNRLIELEQYAVSVSAVDEDVCVGVTADNIRGEAAIRSGSSRIDIELQRRSEQRASMLGDSELSQAMGQLRRGRGLNLDAKNKQRLAYAATAASRNQAEDLFNVLDGLCSHTQQRIAAAAGIADKEIVLTTQHERRLHGLRPKQVEYIEKMLLPVLRRASLEG